MDIQKTGKFIKEQRDKLGLSQNELSSMVHVTRQAVSNWENGKTYSAKGRLNFTTTTEEVIKEYDFGEKDVSVRTISLSELIVTKGTQAPLEDDMAFAPADLAAALKEHKAYLESLKDKTNIKTKATPAPTSANQAFDLGF